MKKLFTILFILTCYTVSAQVNGVLDGINITGSKTHMWWKVGKFSTLNPPKSMPVSGRDTGSLYYNIPQSAYYAYNGSTWVKVGNIPVDSSASINNRILANLQRVLDSLSNHITKINGKQPAGAYITNIPVDSSVSINNRVNSKVNISDTSGMLGNYVRQQRLIDSLSAHTTRIDSKQAALVSNTNIKTVNGTSLLGAGDIGVSGTSTTTFVNLASNFSSTITTEATVTGWSFAVITGKTYRIEVIASYQTAATTTGGELGFFLSNSAVGTIRGFAQADIVSTAAATGLKQPITVCTTADAAGSNLISSGVTAINSPHSFYAIVTFTCTTSGTFNVGWASEVSSSAAQLNANSSLIYQTLN